MSVRLAIAASAFAAALAAACSPTNPFDPDTPSSLQAPGSVRGVIQAVTSPIDPDSGAACDAATDAPICNFADTSATPCCVPEPSFCGAVDGDHSGFSLVLRGLSADDAESAIRSQSQNTNESGAFVFANVPPGAYSLEIVRDGFAVPVPRNVDVIPGDNVNVGTLCGVNATAPARPVLDTLPASVRVSAAGAPLPSVNILGCAAGIHYDVVQSLKDGVTHETVVDGAGNTGGVCTVAATVAPSPGVSDVWHIEARASDALQNTSDAAAADVVLDATPPRVPCDVQALAAEDRVIVSWGITADVDGGGDGVVDGTVCQRESALDAARWIVSYTLSERPPAACPSSSEGDDFDIAAFAVEGPSPVPAASPSLTLSGILPGTDLFVQVASVDDVGNPSCWSDPVRTRPDLVTPALVVDDAAPRAAVAGIFASSTNDGVTAWAQGNGGLSVRGVDGSVVSFDTLPSFDVVVSGPHVFAAGGALGVHVLDLDEGGAAAGAPGSIDGDTVNAIAAIPGGLVLGTDTGVHVIDLADPASSPPPGLAGAPVTRVDVHSGIIAAARDDGTLSLALLASPGNALASVPLSGAVSALRIIDDEVWSTSGSFVDVVPIGACPQAPCPGARVRFQLPHGVRAVDVAAWDDLVLVLGSVDDAENADPGGVFIYDGNGEAPALVGRAFPPAGATDMAALAPGNGGFCADATVAGIAGGAPHEICWSTVAFPLVATTTDLANAAAVSDAQPVGAFAWTRGAPAGAGGETVSLWRFAGGGEELARDTVPASGGGGGGANALLSVVAVPGGLFAIDDEARLLFAPESDRGSEDMRVVDDTAVAQEVDAVLSASLANGDPVFPLGGAILAADGPNSVIVAVHATQAGACRPGALLRIDLGVVAGGGGDLLPRVDAVDSVALSATAERLSALDVAGGVARIGEKPFAVVAVDAATLVEDAARSIPAAGACSAAGQTSQIQAFARLGGGGTSRGRLVASGNKEAGGAALVNGVFDIDGGGAALVSDPGATFNALGASGTFLAVATDAGTVLLDSRGPAVDALRPVLTFPNAAQVVSVAGTGRGLLFSNGPSGALAIALR